MAMGPIMAIGGVDMLIPPSALAVLLGSLAGISISKLLIGGIVPGIILSVVFVGYIVLRVRARPELAPSDEFEPVHGWARWKPLFIYVLPLLLIFGVVVGLDVRRLGHAHGVRGLGRDRHHLLRRALPRVDLEGPA